MDGYWQTFQRTRVSRRRLLATAGAGAGGLAMASLLPSSAFRPSGAQATEAARYGGTYVFPVTFDWGTLDPATSVAFGPSVFPRIYNSLVIRSARDPDFFFLDLAEELEVIDEETYLFRIRPGVRIAPNSLDIPERDMDAIDAMRWLDHAAESPIAILHTFVSEWLQTHNAPNLHTLHLATNGPYAYLLHRLGSPLGGCIPPREFFVRGKSKVAQGAGAGPWGAIVPNSFSETGGVVLQRNPNYYRRSGSERLPYIDRLEGVRIVDRQPRRTAFIERQIDEYDAADREEVDQLLSIIADLQVAEEPAMTFISFVMNPTRPPWNDERIRKAALYALNRQAFVDVIVGADGGRPDGLVPWYMGGYALPPEELEALQPYNPAMSRDLIMAATGQETVDITVMYPANSDIERHNQHLPIFLQQMQDAGFNIIENPQEFTNWLQNYTNVDYDASLALNQIYETPEIPLDFHAAHGPVGGDQYAIGIGALFPEIEQAIQDSKRAVDTSDQIEKVRAAQRLLYARGPAFLPIMSWIDFTLVHSYVKKPYQTRGLGNAGLYLSDWWLTEDAPRAGVFGDASCDGTLNSVDAAVVLQSSAGVISSAPCGYKADANHDGRIDSRDAALMLQRVAGLIPPLR